MKRALWLLLLCGGVAFGQTSYVERKEGQTFRATAPSTAPASCTFGKSPNVLANDTGVNYRCDATNAYVAFSSGGVTIAGQPNYSQNVSGTSAVLTHNLGTKNLLVVCYDASDVAVEPDSIDIDTADPWDVTVSFATSHTGRCVVNGTGGVALRYGEDFAAATTVTMLGSEHGLGTKDLSVTCYDDDTPAHQIEADAITVSASTFDVVVTFASSVDGRCEVQ